MAEPITFKCFKCKGDVTVDAALSGFTVACPYCEATLTVPVMMSPTATSANTKIRLKRDTPGHLKVEDHDPVEDDYEEQQQGEEEVEYIYVDEEPPSKKKLFIGIAVIAILLIAGVGVFFGVKSYLAHEAQVKEEQRIAQEAAAKAAELAARETRLQPVWDDAAALAERTRKLKTNVENVIAIFEGLKAKDFAGTKFAGMAEDELKRLKILNDAIAEEQQKAKEAADAEAAKKAQQQTQQQQQKPAQQQQQQKPQQPDPAAAKKAAEERFAKLLAGLTKQTMSGDWKAAAALIAAFPEKDQANALKPIFDTALAQDKAVMDTLKEDEGKEISISFKSGTEVVKIISVRNNNVQGSQKFDKATIQKNFSDDDLSVAERVARVARVNPETAAFIQVAAECAKENFDEALKCLDTMQLKSKASEALRNQIKAEVVESAAQDEFDKITGKMHFKASMSPGEMTAEIAKIKVASQGEKDDLKNLVNAYREKYKATKFVKNANPKLDAIAKAISALPITKPATPPPTSAPSASQKGLGGKPAFK